MSVNSYDIDFVAGFGSALAYALLMVIALYALLKYFKLKITASAVCASVGFSLLPLTLVIFLLVLFPSHIGVDNASFLFPCALVWALGYLVMDIGSSMIPRSDLSRALPTLVLGVLLTHFVGGRLIENGHLCTLRRMRIPIISVRDTIADEFPQT